MTEKHFQMSMQPEFGQKNSGLLKQEVVQKACTWLVVPTKASICLTNCPPHPSGAVIPARS